MPSGSPSSAAMSSRSPAVISRNARRRVGGGTGMAPIVASPFAVGIKVSDLPGGTDPSFPDGFAYRWEVAMVPPNDRGRRTDQSGDQAVTDAEHSGGRLNAATPAHEVH